MSSPIKKVAIAGAGGNLGPSILKALLGSNLFDITILTRSSPKSSFPSTANVVAVDYSSHASLTTALTGQDALVSVLSSAALSTQEALIEAAIAAGVKRFISSEFGSDTHNPKAATLAVYHPKVAIQAILADRAARGLISYTEVVNGPFLDLSLENGLILNLKEKKVTYADGGGVRISSTTREHVGTAVVGVLAHPEETRNRAVYVANYHVSQKEAVAVAKKIVGEDGWTETHAKSADLEAEAWADLKAKKFDGPLWLNFITRTLYGEGYGGDFVGKDNALLGVPEFSEADFEKLVKSVAGKN